MGVLFFFRYICLKYKNKCIISLNGSYEKCESVISKNIPIDYALYDLNAIFHPVCQEIYQYGNGKKEQHKSFLHTSKNKNRSINNPKDVIIYKRICQRINELKNIINPRTGLVLAVDGVAGCSKIAQQRKRRFKSTLESSSVPEEDRMSFDPNSLSTGTVYMENLNKYIVEYIEDKMTSDDKWSSMNVKFSSHRISGEGEHKLMDTVKNNITKTHCVISPDADIIFLLCLIYKAKCYVFRENIFDDIEGQFFIVDIDKFRQCILEEIGLLDEKIPDEIKEKAMTDFVVYCFSVGNDFLPSIPSLSISNNAIETLFDIYPKLIKEHGHLIDREKLCFNKKSLQGLFNELSLLEYDMILKYYVSGRATFPDPLLNKHMTRDETSKYRHSLNYEAYRAEYYAIKFPNESSVEKIVHEYIKGMTFVLKYYVKGIPSWEWQFPYHYSPFLIDIAKYIDTLDVDIKFNLAESLSPLEQLLSIIPPKSSKLLPEPLRFLLTDKDSPIIDLYPLNFDIDLDGKKNEYEGIPLIPHINYYDIKKSFALVKNKLSKEDLKLNELDTTLEYYKDTDGDIVCVNECL